MCTLFTVGYEGSDIETFINKIIKNNITTVIDVRQIPISRKYGFSKTKLKLFLQDKGINYLHFPKLGSPKDIRHKLYETKNYDDFFCDYRVYAVTKLDEVMNVLDIAENGSSCLMCFEHDYSLCHRKILSEMLVTYSDVIDGVVNIT